MRVGEEVAFTGYLIGMILGLYPATHRATVSARTPMVIPARHSDELDARRIRALRNDSPMVFQLDATAYPGNSGSPLFRMDSGEVVGVINQVFVQGGREAAIGQSSNPQGSDQGNEGNALIGAEMHRSFCLETALGGAFPAGKRVSKRLMSSGLRIGSWHTGCALVGSPFLPLASHLRGEKRGLRRNALRKSPSIAIGSVG